MSEFIPLIFAALMLMAAWDDATKFKISNVFPAALVLLWPVMLITTGAGWQDALIGLGVGLTTLLICMALWAPGWIGGGDGKLIAATALWFSWPDVLSFLGVVVLAGGVLSLSLVMLRKAAPAFGLIGDRVSGTALEEGAAAPYAIAIAAGALIVLPGSHII